MHWEGNGNPLQCSCLENPRDGGAWWAAIYGVAQSQIRLKRLSSSSSICVSGFPYGSAGKEFTCSAGDLGLIPGLGRSHGGGKGHQLQYSGLENSMDCIGHGVANSWTRLSDFHFHAYIILTASILSLGGIILFYALLFFKHYIRTILLCQCSL